MSKLDIVKKIYKNNINTSDPHLSAVVAILIAAFLITLLSVFPIANAVEPDSTVPSTVILESTTSSTSTTTIPEVLIQRMELPVEEMEYVPSTTTTTTIVVAPYRSRSPEWICPQWHQTALDAGWPQEQLSKLSYVMYRESRCNPESHNPDDPNGGSNGLVQINQFWCRPSRYWPDGWLQAQGVLTSCDQLFDPTINLTAALAIWYNSGWSPWAM